MDTKKEIYSFAYEILDKRDKCAKIATGIEAGVTRRQVVGRLTRLYPTDTYHILVGEPNALNQDQSDL
jgi:hypothetical protein